jgi:hypothetical protein
LNGDRVIRGSITFGSEILSRIQDVPGQASFLRQETLIRRADNPLAFARRDLNEGRRGALGQPGTAVNLVIGDKQALTFALNPNRRSTVLQ